MIAILGSRMLLNTHEKADDILSNRGHSTTPPIISSMNFAARAPVVLEIGTERDIDTGRDTFEMDMVPSFEESR